MCKEVSVHQNCLVTNIIQNIFCLPQAKEMHPVLELFWVNYTFKWKPHPTNDFIGRINQAVTSQEKIKTNEIRRAEFVLNWFEKLKYYSYLQYLIMLEMGDQIKHDALWDTVFCAALLNTAHFAWRFHAYRIFAYCAQYIKYIVFFRSSRSSMVVCYSVRYHALWFPVVKFTLRSGLWNLPESHMEGYSERRAVFRSGTISLQKTRFFIIY